MPRNFARKLPFFTVVAALGLSCPARAADLKWKGFDWNLTDGGMAGVADGSSANISVDGDGYLHLRVVKNGNTWTASEMFTVQKLGFGTYQWQIEGPIDVFDKQMVLGLFPYGPAAGIGGDGTNEIDIEFSRWGQANGPNADFTDYPNSGNVVGETTFKFSLDGGTSSTARFTWTKDSIESSVLKGHQPLASEAQLIKKWKYAPDNASTNIPQQAMPLGMNLWCFGAPPTDGQNVEIVIRDFQFIKEGDPIPGSGTGGGGAAGGGGTNTGGDASGGNASGGNSGGGTNNGGTNNGGAHSGGVASGGGGATAEPSGGMPTLGGSAPTGGGSTAAGANSAGMAPSAGGANAGPSGDGAESGTDGGCSCRVAPDAGSRSLALLTIAALGLALRKRQRAQRAK
ncbi:MAG TPA: glycoside hydrolase family 16 protein [Polyangiaceae bacterium]|nr:glycoside hydrolase family 16 protein [Polyangiaceae bacterium]